jgi:hypothetical protein
MKKACIGLICLAFAISVPLLALASGTITAKASLGMAKLSVGKIVEVPVDVELKGLPEKLGSFTAVLKWDASVLQFDGFTGGKTEGFEKAVVNQKEVGSGILKFASAHPYGGEGLVNLMNVRFKVIGKSGASARLSLAFSAMAAADTFHDLLPFLADGGVFEETLDVVAAPENFSLSRNYPNPFNPDTGIRYQLPEEALVKLAIFNVLGQPVRVLVDRNESIGFYSVRWDGRDDRGLVVPSGVYVVRLQANSFVAQHKITLLK